MHLRVLTSETSWALEWPRVPDDRHSDVTWTKALFSVETILSKAWS